MSGIRNIVVLMLENRSFDHMLGYSHTDDLPLNGLTGNESNYLHPVPPTGTPVKVSDTATYVPDQDPDPGHEFANVAVQLHGPPSPLPPSGSNIGFVADYATVAGDARAGEVMRCYGSGKLPVLQTLAREFAVCDAWFSSMPGPTWPNRLFAHCATSGGYTDSALRSYDMRTIYQNLSDAGVDWRVYYHDMPQTLALANLRRYFRTKYELFGQAFARDCRDGRLPPYSFIEPRYFNAPFGARANDQHPFHGVVGGELLIADIYEAIRSSPQWPDTLLIITWDEHGGFYDHVPPPAATPPDAAVANFDFASYGVRVPAIAVSPRIPPATVDRRVYDHSSIPATIKSVFKLPAFLSHRDAAANTLEHLCWTAPRTDAPLTLPRPSVPETPMAMAPTVDELAQPNRLQQDLLDLARSIGLPIGIGHVARMSSAAAETEAADEVQAHLEAFARAGDA